MKISDPRTGALARRWTLSSGLAIGFSAIGLALSSLGVVVMPPDSVEKWMLVGFGLFLLTANAVEVIAPPRRWGGGVLRIMSIVVDLNLLSVGALMLLIVATSPRGAAVEPLLIAAFLLPYSITSLIALRAREVFYFSRSLAWAIALVAGAGVTLHVAGDYGPLAEWIFGPPQEDFWLSIERNSQISSFSKTMDGPLMLLWLVFLISGFYRGANGAKRSRARYEAELRISATTR